MASKNLNIEQGMKVRWGSKTGTVYSVDDDYEGHGKHANIAWDTESAKGAPAWVPVSQLALLGNGSEPAVDADEPSVVTAETPPKDELTLDSAMEHAVLALHQTRENIEERRKDEAKYIRTYNALIQMGVSRDDMPKPLSPIPTEFYVTGQERLAQTRHKIGEMDVFGTRLTQVLKELGYSIAQETVEAALVKLFPEIEPSASLPDRGTPDQSPGASRKRAIPITDETVREIVEKVAGKQITDEMAHEFGYRNRGSLVSHLSATRERWHKWGFRWIADPEWDKGGKPRKIIVKAGELADRG
jgi:hypothetical protein